MRIPFGITETVPANAGEEATAPKNADPMVGEAPHTKVAEIPTPAPSSPAKMLPAPSKAEAPPLSERFPVGGRLYHFWAQWTFSP